MTILKYSQANGFEPCDADPFKWKDGQELKVALSKAGFSGEEAEGAIGSDDDAIVEHYYNDKTGQRFTVVNGPCRYEMIMTENDAEHIALRIALAPLVHVKMAEELAIIRRDFGTLKKWDEERRRHIRNRRERTGT